ncbi:TRAP-type uncharacterized transport system, substrate-binding protein [Nannocystis exedens]|uniref:TRAP-type uncharacterized transport system, substrate-binding protein n=2 Tax=Nannocystis exedens TaxID=54 RepID=A0A1I2EAP4_9BACT|nr:TRAP ABC transporter substrate-binding protein [Nannocystis exedens]SFE89558.1 TRAP-type uncharacterized transport system, substrate-binding protein [Nannocystis exedens]
MFLRTWPIAPVLLGMFLQTGAARAGDAIVVRFGSGAKKGGFDNTAQALAEAVRGEGRVVIAPESTKGSCENVHKLLSGELDAALVQYDVAAEAFKAGLADADAGDSAIPKGGWMCKLSPEEADKAELRVIAAVSDAAVHVLVRRPVRLDDFAEIGREPLFMGKDGSGSYETAKVILGAAGHTAEQLPLFTGTADEALAAMSRRELLAMLRTTERGHTDIRDVLASGLATLNPLPEAVLNRLIDGYPYYRICPIETGTYPGLEYSLPTVCVSSVVLVATPRERLEDEGFLADRRLAVEAMIHGLKKLARDEQYKRLGVRVEWRGFAEREPIPLHPVAELHETSERRRAWLEAGASAAALGGALYLARRALRRRRVPGAGLESQLSNPLVPFAAFACVVALSTFIVWSLEHDSNARLRTLNDSFWEMNTFATGNFTTDTLKTPTARLVGAAATILGLGLLAWFTATLTNIFAQEQTRLWRRLSKHLVVLNFREDMLPLIRLLRSPGPTRHRALHVVVSDALPRRVRLQLARVKALTIHSANPEVPEDLAGLRLPRASRVIVLGDGETNGASYDPLRIARAVHQACARDPIGGGQRARPLGVAATSVEIARTAPALPVTLVETSDAEREEVFSPFAGWLVPVDCQALAHRWLVMACRDRAFAELFNRVVAFADDNAEVYTAPAPTWLIGQPWRKVRRALLEVQGRGGAVPLGLYRPADPGGKAPVGGTSHAELRRRLIVNPRPDETVVPGDLIVALCEDEADLVRIVAESRKVTPAS